MSYLSRSAIMISAHVSQGGVIEGDDAAVKTTQERLTFVINVISSKSPLARSLGVTDGRHIFRRESACPERPRSIRKGQRSKTIQAIQAMLRPHVRSEDHCQGEGKSRAEYQFHVLSRCRPSSFAGLSNRTLPCLTRLPT